MKFFLHSKMITLLSCVLGQSLEYCFPNLHVPFSSPSTPSPWLILSTHISLAHHILVFLLSSKPIYTLPYCISLLGCLTGIINSTYPRRKSLLVPPLRLSLPASHAFLLFAPFLIERHHQLCYVSSFPSPLHLGQSPIFTQISVLRYHFNITIFLHPSYHHHLSPGLAGDRLLPGIPDSNQSPLPRAHQSDLYKMKQLHCTLPLKILH